MKTFVLTDESLNSYGFWLPLSGAVLDQFRKNPIMLWMHNRAWRGTKEEVLPIGYWDNIRIEKGKLLADAIFDEGDDFATQIGDKVEAGVLRMASCGIKVIETSTDPKWLKPGQTWETPTKWSLREASIVDIGSNDNALSLVFYDEKDELINLSDNPSAVPLKKIDTNTDTKTETSMKNLLKLMNLAETDGEDKAISAYQALADKLSAAETAKTTAEGKLAAYETADKTRRQDEMKTLLDGAIREGRIDAGVRSEWEKLFESNHDSTKKTLLSIPVRKSVKEQVEGAGDANAKEREELAKLSWDEADKGGKTGIMKEKYYDLYEEKFEARFGKKPNKQ